MQTVVHYTLATVSTLPSAFPVSSGGNRILYQIQAFNRLNAMSTSANVNATFTTFKSMQQMELDCDMYHVALLLNMK